MNRGMGGADPQSAAEALAVKRRVEAELLAIPGVHAVGFGAKTTDGRPTGELVIRVEVLHKRPLAEVPAAERIPAEIDGVKTDVVQSTPPVPHASIQGGDEIRVQEDDITWSVGTLGCIAHTTASPPKLVILSNQHVLDTAANSPVIVTSCSDCCETVVAHVLPGAQLNQTIDAAIAEVVAGQESHARIHGVPVTGTLDLQDTASLPPAVVTALGNLTYRVHKYGAKTDLTTGVVTSIHQTTGTMTEQIQVMTGPPQATTRFDKEGDSGSAIYNDAGQVVALLWGGSDEDANPPFQTVGSPIAKVESMMGITVATNPPAVIYRAGALGIPEVARGYADLGRAAAPAPLADLYDRHQPEVRALLRSNRRFVIAWHRNHGPLMVRSLLDVAEHRLREVPGMLADRPWPECVARIARVLTAEGSAALQADVTHWEPFVARLGGRSYEDAIRIIARAAGTPAPAAAPRSGGR
jgi:Trypsin-like peptidase domain